MKNLLISLILITIVFCTCAFKSDSDQKSRIARIENGLLPEVIIEGEPTWTLAERMQYHKVPGVSIAVIHDFKIDCAKGYGVMDTETKEPVTERTRFQAASISKPVAAMAALKKVQDGKIALEENINTYLQSWKLPDNEFTARKKVTLKHLINHSGGVTVHGFRGYAINEEVPILTQILDGQSPANSPSIRVDMEPETQFRYAGGGFTIMQQALIDIEQKPFPEILHETVLGPLNMDHSTYEQLLPEKLINFASAGHRSNGELVAGKRHTYPEMAAAGLWTTPSDLAKFAIELQLSLKGESNKVLSRETTELMLTPFVDDSWGLGIVLEKKGDTFYFQHGGANAGFRCQLIANKESGYGAVVMTNSDNGGRLYQEIIRSIAKEYKWQDYLPEPYQIVKVDPKIYDRYSGRYLIDSDNILTVSNENDRLFAQDIRSPKIEIFPIAENRFIRKDRDFVYEFLAEEQGKVNNVNVYIYGRRESNHRVQQDFKIPFELAVSGDIDAAVAAYRKIENKEENSLAAEGRLNNLGYNLLSQNRFQEAIAILTINVELYPTSANTYDSLAEAYMLSGNKELAIKFYKQVLEALPNDLNRSPQAKKSLENNAKKKIKQLQSDISER